MLQDLESEEDEIPLQGGDAVVLDKALMQKVLEFCDLLSKEAFPDLPKPIKTSKVEDILGKDSQYTKFIRVEHELLFRILLAAKFLQIPKLMELGCMYLATLLYEKSEEAVYKEFSITPPTHEQKKRIIEANPWIFDIKPADPPPAKPQ